jgi:hypothetical protein
MPKRWLLVCMASVLLAQPASAQPLFRFDQNWTIGAGDNLFGLREVIMVPGNARWTQVWLGRCSFDIRCRAAEVIPLVLFAAIDRTTSFWCLIEWGSFHRLP